MASGLHVSWAEVMLMPVVIAGVIGLVSGFLGTKAMEPVTTKMYEAESEEYKQREKQAQPRYTFA